MTKRLALLVALTATIFSLSACGDADDGGAAEPQQTYTSRDGDVFNDADADFATDMIQHHAQALVMVDLTAGRKLDAEVAELADEILMAQGPEIELMVTWLTDWERPVPETVRDHANAHGDGHASDAEMPGMMSSEQMAELEDAPDADFQRLWLEMMIQHHEGAITMAEAEQEAGRFGPAVELAEQIVTSQQTEIATMRDLLGV